MEPEIIKDDETTLAIIIRNSDFKEGLNFFSKDEDFVQVGTWNYNEGKILKAHNHLISERSVNRTQEVVIIRSGKLKADFYSEDDRLIKSEVLSGGDIIICLAGGHGYEVLEDKTQVLEVKNGPYLGVEKDKRLISNS